MKKLYLIGNVKSYKEVNLSLRKKLYSTQIELMKLGFEVYNPCENEALIGKSKSAVIRENLKHLINSQSVYVMSDVDIKTNVEVQLANQLNMVVIQGVFLPIWA